MRSERRLSLSPPGELEKIRTKPEDTDASSAQGHAAERGNAAPIFIDIEASGLHPDSYPIEIAWVMADGQTESYLIDPSPITRWTHWDPNAERLHGISRTKLFSYGDHPLAVAIRMSEVLRAQTLYSDAPSYDAFWLKVLWDAAEVLNGSELMGPAGVRNFFELSGDAAGDRKHADGLSVLGRIYDETRASAVAVHRAENDARLLYEVWRRVVEGGE